MQVAAPSSPGLLYGPDRLMAPKKSAAASPDLSAGERDVLAQERALKASAAGGATSTTYIYATGPDGKRYIVGAQVTITGSEDVVDGVTGGRKTKASQSLKPADKAAEAATSAKEPDKNHDDTIAQLKQTEREVIAHEAAHKAAAGRFGGPVSYTYTTGPDGKKYITGGEVPISTPATNDPEEALRNAQQVMRAAMAPGDPSGQDISAAANAAQTAASARAEMAQEGTKETARSAQKINAYAKQASPRGLWTAQEGYVGGIADTKTPAEEPRQAFEIAA